jgi:multimeric flavodoxin WrbA
VNFFNFYKYIYFCKFNCLIFLRGDIMKNVLIVYYSLGGNTKTAAEAVAEGIKKGGAQPIVKNGLDANAEDLINCDGLIVGSPDYFSFMAGGLKDFFDRTYYPTKGKIDGKPYAAFITCGGGGNAIMSVVKMCQRFKLIKIIRPIIINNKPDKISIEKLINFGYSFSTILNSPDIYNKKSIYKENKIIGFIRGKLKKLNSIRYRF